MLSALKIEWMKVKNYRTFWILLAITTLSIPSISYLLYDLMDNSFPKSKGVQMVLGSPFAFPDIWQTAAWNASLFFIVPGLLIITLTANEFTFKTHRQNIIDGWSRQQFFGVKMIEVLLLSIFCTIVVFFTILAFGYIGNTVPASTSAWVNSRFLFFYFMDMLTYAMIAFLLSMLIKRAGLSIGVFLMFLLGIKIIAGLLREKFKIPESRYLPGEVADKLIPFPYARTLLARDSAQWEHLIPSLLVVTVLYLIAYGLIISRRFLRSDL